MRSFILVLFALLLFPVADLAQARWYSYYREGPDPRMDHQMVYDSARKKIVLFGGMDTSYEYLNDTWEWDVVNKTWTRINTSKAPRERNDFAMAYDPVRHRVVVQGGVQTYDNTGNGSYSPSTWEYNGTTWNYICGDGPERVGYHEMVYDSRRSQMVTYGGFCEYNCNQNTWAYQNLGWTRVSGTSAGTRYSYAMYYDKNRGVAVLQGGYDEFGATQPSVHEWAGKNWVKKYPADAGPSYRNRHKMVYADSLKAGVLFGGAYKNNGEVLKNDIWTWNGTRWQQLSVNASYDKPAPRSRYAMAYDSHNDGIWVFGGETSDGFAERAMWFLPFKDFGASADLKLFKLKSKPFREVVSGGYVNCSMKVKNIGKSIAPAFKITVYASLDEEVDDLDYVIGRASVDSLLAARSRISITLTCRFKASVPVDNYWIIAVLEPLDEEKNSANNVAITRKRIAVLDEAAN